MQDDLDSFINYMEKDSASTFFGKTSAKLKELIINDAARQQELEELRAYKQRVQIRFAEFKNSAVIDVDYHRHFTNLDDAIMGSNKREA